MSFPRPAAGRDTLGGEGLACLALANTPSVPGELASQRTVTVIQ